LHTFFRRGSFILFILQIRNSLVPSVLASAAQIAGTTARALRPVFFPQMGEGADTDAPSVFTPSAILDMLYMKRV
jgi:hypothetical protein